MASIVYWKMTNARGTLPAIINAYGEGDMKWDDATANTWPATKASATFGQLPYLVDGDAKVSQSMAIARYVGTKCGLHPTEVKYTHIHARISIKAQV